VEAAKALGGSFKLTTNGYFYKLETFGELKPPPRQLSPQNS